MTLPFEIPRETATERVKRTAFVTFVLHLLFTALSLPVASLVTNALNAVAGDHPDGLIGWRDGSAFGDIVKMVLDDYGGTLFGATLLGSLAALALGIPLGMTWLAALAGQDRFQDALVSGLRLSPRAIQLMILMLVPRAVLVIFGAVVGVALHFAIGTANPAHHDTAVAGAIVGTVLLLALASAWSDISRAHLAHHLQDGLPPATVLDAFEAGRKGVLRLFPRYLLWRGAMLLLTLAGFALGQAPWPLAVLLGSQSMALLRSFFRAQWLATATGSIHRPHGRHAPPKVAPRNVPGI